MGHICSTAAQATTPLLPLLCTMHRHVQRSLKRERSADRAPGHSQPTAHQQVTTAHPQNHFHHTSRYVLKNLMRDWSADGAPERTQSYGRIIKELSTRYQGWQNPQQPPRVLVPGGSCHLLEQSMQLAHAVPAIRTGAKLGCLGLKARELETQSTCCWPWVLPEWPRLLDGVPICCAGAGLGRLCLEVASLGLEAQGNEFSYYMLLASSFVLNQSARAGQWTVFPWLHTNCNQRCIGDQLRGVSCVTVSGTTNHRGPLP